MTPLRYRAICREGCGVLHLTDLPGAARNAASAHLLGSGHDTLVQTRAKALDTR